MGDDYWIKEAIGKKGSYRASVYRRHGRRGFTNKGTIKREIIEADVKRGGKIGKQAKLARTLRGLRR